MFFGYPQEPATRAEVMRETAQKLRTELGFRVTLWEDMATEGRLVVENVLQEIDRSQHCIFDLTLLSENVLFETGYAIARGKTVWIALDSSDSRWRASWAALGILSPVGYTGYRNSQELSNQIIAGHDSHGCIFDDVIEPSFGEPESARSLLYCSTFEPFEASYRLSNLIEERRKQGLKVTISDPSESSLEPITWYAPKINNAVGVLVHFVGRYRRRSASHNSRHALVAGIAAGLEIPLLMLAEEDYAAPFDYETKLVKYDTAAECVDVTRKWLESLKIEGIEWSIPRKSLRGTLAGLRFGEHVAENEITELAEYFVETSAYEDVVASRDTIFVGQRGTGKTANATQAFDHLDAKKTNLAVLIKLPGFEFPAMLEAVAGVPDVQHEYFFDSLWRFIVQTEIAAKVFSAIEAKPIAVPRTAEEKGFLEYIESAPFKVSDDVSVRLQQAFGFIVSYVRDVGIKTTLDRDFINEAFHMRALAELRHHLGSVLKGKRRVAVFIDNLDKGWERGANFRVLAQLILGLLTARGRLVADFSRSDHWRDEVKLTVSVFLRADIFNYLKAEAREPDKLPISTITWRDPETLLKVVEARFIYNSDQSAPISNLWGKYFCPSIDGIEVKEYIVSSVLPRPRDVVYFCNLAVARAIDRGHSRVEAADFSSSLETYSQYAYEALLVENGVTIPELEESLFSFLGEPAVRTRGQIMESLSIAGISNEKLSVVIRKLVESSFLGIETSVDNFEFPEIGMQFKRAEVAARRLVPNELDQRLTVHKAFRAFLGIED
ncbi:P-loop ATPase, Sll1717 family [Qaidamihabitans albus]|uniref:P-loop ATPase, Sll1717 family n=1 Tax=Qaidamihabitans albus TaxID=2795733 RepID=UPI0035590F99